MRERERFWCVQRVFGDEWRTICITMSEAAAHVLMRCWHEGGDHQGYRVVESDNPPADWLLAHPAPSKTVRRAILEAASALLDYLQESDE